MPALAGVAQQAILRAFGTIGEIGEDRENAEGLNISLRGDDAIYAPIMIRLNGNDGATRRFTNRLLVSLEVNKNALDVTNYSLDSGLCCKMCNCFLRDPEFPRGRVVRGSPHGLRARRGLESYFTFQDRCGWRCISEGLRPCGQCSRRDPDLAIAVSLRTSSQLNVDFNSESPRARGPRYERRPPFTVWTASP